MEKVIGKKEVDDIKYFCDGCEKQLQTYLHYDCAIDFDFGYGSSFDGDSGDTIFCTECSHKVLNVLQASFPNIKFIEPQLKIN